MNKKFFTVLLSVPIFTCGWSNIRYNNAHRNFGALSIQTHKILQSAYNLNPIVLKAGIHAYLKARSQGIDKKGILTIIDYSRPSTEKRLWVIDLKRAKILFNTWVTHGKNSGKIKPTAFSNRNGTKKSSIGVFATGKTYFGKSGYSLHINGLEKGINDNAYKRNVVIHGAWYAEGKVAKKYGQLGRSWGCPAVGTTIAKPIINTIKHDTLLLAWYPDKNWLNNSDWVRG